MYNIGPVTKWSGEGGLGIISINNTIGSSVQPFQIFVENEFGGGNTCGDNNLTSVTESKAKTGISIGGI